MGTFPSELEMIDSPEFRGIAYLVDSPSGLNVLHEKWRIYDEAKIDDRLADRSQRMRRKRTAPG